MRHRLLSWLASAAVLTACHSTVTHAPAGAAGSVSPTDAGREPDAAASTLDAGSAAAELPVDAGAPPGKQLDAPATGGAAASMPGGKSAEKPSIELDSAPPDNKVTEIATTELQAPSDLAFNPYAPDELWVVNHADSSATIIQNASQSSRKQLRRLDPEGARHFMASPSALAFGGRETSIVDAQGKPVIGTFASCQENAESFMGPTLWTPDLRIFGIAKSDREPPFNSDDTGAEGPGSHIDMLHRTRNCVGIAWEGTGNLYWTYSGSDARFVRYDFGRDHGIGNADHVDGSVWRYPVSGIGYLPGVPGHLVWDASKQRVYMADPAHGRVVSFDPKSATTSTEMSSADNVDYLPVAMDMSGGQVTDLVPASYGLERPSGLELRADFLYVSDSATSTIHKLTTSGKPVTRVTIPGVKAGGLAGLAFGVDGKLYFVDMQSSRVLRLDAAF